MSGHLIFSCFTVSSVSALIISAFRLLCIFAVALCLISWVGCLACQLKKRCTTWELQVKFYLWGNADCSPGGSISDSSENLLQSSSGGKSIYKVSLKGRLNTMKYSFYKRFFVNHEDLMSLWGNLVLLWIRDVRMEIIKPIPENIQLSKDLSHQIPWSTECLTPPWTPQEVLNVNSCSSTISIEEDSQWLCCSLVGSAFGKCQFVAHPLWS